MSNTSIPSAQYSMERKMTSSISGLRKNTKMKDLIPLFRKDSQLISRNRINISFEDLHYEIKTKQSNVKILNGVSGIFKAGQITAIMGASGSGKTSLLNVLSQRVNLSRGVTLTGEFHANKTVYSANEFPKFGVYVMQSDILMASMSPREAFEFAADLRVNKTAEQKNLLVNEIIYEFRLGKCCETYVGDEMIKGISGGERRRTSIAVELITNPEVILLDEPTSGLDSFTAFLIISVLKDQASKGKTVAFTIHQPNTDIYELFNNITLMVEGKFIYSGSAAQCIQYFARLGFTIPRFCNVGDFFAQLMHRDYKPKQYEKRVNLFLDEYSKAIEPELKQQLAAEKLIEIRKVPMQTTFFFQLKCICDRSFTDAKRNPLIMKARIFQTIFLALMMGLIFWQLDDDAQKFQNITNRNGLLFTNIGKIFMMAMQPVLLTFPIERRLFLKEENSKMYGVAAYYFGKTIVEVPTLIAFPIIFTVPVYYMVKLRDGFDKLCAQILVYIGIAFAGNALGLLIGSFFSEPRVASQVAPLIFMPFSFFCGYYKNRKDLPKSIQWFEYTSPLKYGFSAAIKSQYEGSKFQSGVTITGVQFSYWGNILYLFLIGLGYRILALISLKACTNKAGG